MMFAALVVLVGGILAMTTNTVEASRKQHETTGKHHGNNKQNETKMIDEERGRWKSTREA